MEPAGFLQENYTSRTSKSSSSFNIRGSSLHVDWRFSTEPLSDKESFLFIPGELVLFFGPSDDIFLVESEDAANAAPDVELDDPEDIDTGCTPLGKELPLRSELGVEFDSGCPLFMLLIISLTELPRLEGAAAVGPEFFRQVGSRCCSNLVLHLVFSFSVPLVVVLCSDLDLKFSVVGFPH